MAYVVMALTALSAVSQYRAGQKAEAAAEENARRIKSETEEQARRTKAEQQAKTGEARARARASGIREGGSQDQYIEEMQSEFGRELDWLRASGYSRAASARQQGKIAKTQATGQALGSIANMFAGGYQMGAFGGGGSTMPPVPFKPYG